MRPRRKQRPPRDQRTRGLTRAELWEGIALALTQFAKGVPETAWTPYLAIVAARMHLGLGQLGPPLMGIPVGLGIGALVLAGPITWLLGSRFCLQLGELLWFAAIPFATVVPTPQLLFAALGIGGLGASLIDYAWYRQVVLFEVRTRGRRRPHLALHVPNSPVKGIERSQRDAVESAWVRHANQGLQVTYPMGALAGVGSAALAFALGVDPTLMLASACAVGFVLAFCLSWRLPARPEGKRVKHRPMTVAGPRARLRFAVLLVKQRLTAAAGHRAAAGARARLRFAVLLVACWLVFLPLGIINAWSSLFMRTIGASGTLSTLGLVDYTAATALGAAIAWYRSRRSESAWIAVAGGLLAVGGGLLIVLPANAWAATAGFGMVGLGLAPAGPYLQTRGNQLAQRGNPGLRNVIVIASTYVGGVVGQPLISRLTTVVSLPVALLTIPAAALGVALAAPVAAREDAAGPPDAGPVQE